MFCRLATCTHTRSTYRHLWMWLQKGAACMYNATDMEIYPTHLVLGRVRVCAKSPCPSPLRHLRAWTAPVTMGGRLGAAPQRILAILLFFFIREAPGHAAQDGTSSHRSCSAADASVQLDQEAPLTKCQRYSTRPGMKAICLCWGCALSLPRSPGACRSTTGTRWS